MLRDEPKLLTTHQVARRLGLGEDSVRRKLREGVLPGLRLGSSNRSQYRVREDELQRWLDESSTIPREDPAAREAPDSGSWPAVEAPQRGGETALT